jgi:hypothetical protein
MVSFWGYGNADLLAIIVVAVASLACLISARLFVSRYHS